MEATTILTEGDTAARPALWKLFFIFSAASFCALLPADVILPISQYFKVSVAAAEGVLSFFLLGYAIGPLSVFVNKVVA